MLMQNEIKRKSHENKNGLKITNRTNQILYKIVWVISKTGVIVL